MLTEYIHLAMRRAKLDVKLLFGFFQQSCQLWRIGLADDQVRRPVPGCQAAQGAGQIGDQFFVYHHTRFQVQRFDLKDPLSPVRLGIQPADQPAAL